MPPLAESWELSCHKDGSSVIANGPYAGMTLPEYLARFPDAAGSRCERFPAFPVLFKLIDAKDKLSVQVHPSDDYALREEGKYGKTEMWVVLDCVPGAELIYGFSAPITREEMRRRIEAGTLLEVVNRVPVHPGDVFFIEAGTLHAIGAGIVIAEIQQSSNLTYRVYDYDRRDAQGNPRQLHIEKALAVAERYGLHFVMVTMGPRGCMLVQDGKVWSAETYDTPCIDTTGAGDAFWGATLSQLLELGKRPGGLTEEEALRLIDFSNAAGSMATTKRGAIPAMPDRTEIYECMKSVPRLHVD